MVGRGGVTLYLQTKLTDYNKTCEGKNASYCTSQRANYFNSLTTKGQMTKFSSANFQKMLSSSYITLRIQRLEGKQCM